MDGKIKNGLYIHDRKIKKKPKPKNKPHKNNKNKVFLIETWKINLTKYGKIIKPSGSMKKGGNINEVSAPKIKNFNKIN